MTTATAITKKDRLVWLSLREIQPSPENDLIYRPVNPDDPKIQELADSIEEIGLQEPILVSRDKFIISGHRRYEACCLLNMEKVQCRVRDDVSHTDPEFMTLLAENNRHQRKKNLGEVLRENLVCNNSDDAYEELIEYRKAQLRVSGDFLHIEGIKDRKEISDAKRPMLIAIQDVIRNQREYWPLSDRSIHYDLLSNPPLRHAGKPNSRYRNDRQSYQDLCDILTRARLAAEIPFEAIADPTRSVVSWRLNSEVSDFVTDELDRFLKGYARDRQQTQPHHIEIVGEKNTLKGTIHNVAADYCIPYTLGRGYCSLDPRYQMQQRYENSGKDKLIILVISDFDPEREDIPHSFARSMRDDFGIENVEALKVCLTHEQVLERDLAKTFDAKPSSPRYRKFVAKYGDHVHEVEALSPAERSRLLREAIASVLDIDTYNAEVKEEKREAREIAALRQKANELLADIDEEP
jgi:hypothetical protein